MAYILRRDRLRSLELLFEADKQHAYNQHEADKREVYENLIQELLQKQRHVETYGTIKIYILIYN